MDHLRRCQLGLGTAAFAGADGAEAAREQRLAALLRFGGERLGLEGERAYLETAPWFGDAERLLGSCFRREPALRGCFRVATGWGIRSEGSEAGAPDLSLAGLRRSLETSAAHLHGIDLLYLHAHAGVDLERLRWLLRGGDGAVERMRDLRKRRVHGITRLGISLATPEAVAMLARSPDLLTGFEVLQLEDLHAAEGLDLCARLQSLDLSLVVRSSARGLEPRLLGALPQALLLLGPRDPAQLAQQLAAAAQWAAPRPLELAYASETASASEAREIEASLSAHLAPGAPEPATGGDGATDPDATAERIARVLIGTRKTRLGPAPSGRALGVLQRRIADHAGRGLPVDVILTWGPRKFHAARDDNRVDVAELSAFARLSALQAEVRRRYPPGLRYTLFYEDLEGAFIEGEDDAAFWPYGAGLVRLVNALGITASLRVIATRGLLRRFDLAEVDARLAENYAQLRAHWHGAGDAAALARLGFSGGIDASSRRFYLERLDRLLGERRSREDKQEMVIRLFAAVLLHRQLDMFRVRPDLDPVKLSFLSLAGGPPSLSDGRVDLRSIPADLCKHSLAPWSAKGYLRRREGGFQPATRPWPEPLPDGARLLRGEPRLRRGEASALLRADRLEPSP